MKGPLETVSDVQCAQIDSARIPVQTNDVQRNPQSGRRLLHYGSTLLAVHCFSDASDHDVFALTAQGVQVDTESDPDPFDRWVVVHLAFGRKLASRVLQNWYPFCSDVECKRTRPSLTGIRIGGRATGVSSGMAGLPYEVSCNLPRHGAPPVRVA